SILTSTPPCPALFPYTTLFRSSGHSPRPAAGERDRRGGARGRTAGALPPVASGIDFAGAPDGPHLRLSHLQIPGDRAAGLGQCRDRKSTRLNSSHVKISYAVFC